MAAHLPFGKYRLSVVIYIGKTEVNFICGSSGHGSRLSVIGDRCLVISAFNEGLPIANPRKTAAYGGRHTCWDDGSCRVSFTDIVWGEEPRR